MKMDYKNLGKEVGWGITAIIIGVITGILLAIISILLILKLSGPLEYNGKLMDFYIFGTLWIFFPSIISSGLNRAKNGWTSTIIVGIISCILSGLIGLIIIMIPGGGLSY